MNRKLMSFSALLIISLLTILFLPWTISANENSDVSIEKTSSNIEYSYNNVELTDTPVGNTDYTNENIENTSEDTSTPVGTDTTADEATVNDTTVDTDTFVDEADNADETLDNTSEDTSTTVNDTTVNDTPVKETDILVDEVDDTDENIDNTTEETNNSDGYVLPPLNSNVNVEVLYNESGPLKMGDVVNITAAFDKPVASAGLRVSNEDSSFIDMVNINDTFWYCEYEVPDSPTGKVNVTVIAEDSEGKKAGKIDIDALLIDNEAPTFTEMPEKEVKQNFDIYGTNLVRFNFTASDDLDDNIIYTLYINGIKNNTGVAAKNQNKIVEVILNESTYTWDIILKDKAGNTRSSENSESLYAETKAPRVELLSPEDGHINTEGPINISFIAYDDFTSQYKDLNLTYVVDIEGDPAGIRTGTVCPGENIKFQVDSLSEGAHTWSVDVTDEAGNNITSDLKKFYVDKKGLKVSLISPKNGEAPENKTFKFCVSGGTGLPFDYKLLVNGDEIKKTTCEESEDGELTVGSEIFNNYSVIADVPDGEDLSWTVRVTDCAGNTYEPQPCHFSLNTRAPARVANLSVKDAPGKTQWSDIDDKPKLYVSWNANTDKDLAPTPYEVFISDFEPQSIEDMKKVSSTSYTSLYIEEYDGKSLAYGKDYWVAVISRDMSGNYNKCFVALCGPVKTYEDMNITLASGWNLKSVPKRLLVSNMSPESVFGKNSTVLHWNGTDWDVPKTIEPCKGYWVYSPKALENNIKFKPLSSNDSTPDVPASLNLSTGWQLIGHTSTQPVSWSITLASLKDSLGNYKFSNLVTYSHSEGWSGIIPEFGLINFANGGGPLISVESLTNDSINGSDSGPSGTLRYKGIMVPGQAYWVYMTKAGTYESIEGKSNFQNLSGYRGITSDETNDDVTTVFGNTDDGTNNAVSIEDQTVITEDETLTTGDEALTTGDEALTTGDETLTTGDETLTT